VIYEALVKDQEALFGVVADYIEDYKADHLEEHIYVKRLRSPGVRIRTVIDTVCKFGNKAERKVFSRCDRLAMKMRHQYHRNSDAIKLPNTNGLFGMADRKALNVWVNRGVRMRGKKKGILTTTRKTHFMMKIQKVWNPSMASPVDALATTSPYVCILMQLLGRYYPAPK
jgi:hypothetical protein